MKKTTGKRWLGKKQVITSVLVLVLAAAIYINWQYSDVVMGTTTAQESKTKTGKAEYVATNKVTVETGYFADARTQREKTYNDSVAELESLEKSAKAGEEEKASAYQAHIQLIERQEKQTNIESLVKAKSFADCLCVISDQEVSVVVKAEDLSGSEILQIQDAVLSVLDVPLEKIKIIHVK